jgi:hypothetical protein
MRHTESILVDRLDTEAFLAISDLHELLRWSAWPQLSRGAATVRGDGTSVGSELVLVDQRGRDRARLRLAGASLREIGLDLHLRMPVVGAATGRLAYRLQDVGASATIVMLDVEVPALVGVRRLAARSMVRTLLALAARDLAQLKTHLESADGAR